MNIVEEIFLGLGSQTGEDLREEWIQGCPLFIPFPAFNLRQASQIWEREQEV